MASEQQKGSSRLGNSRLRRAIEREGEGDNSWRDSVVGLGGGLVNDCKKCGSKMYVASQTCTVLKELIVGRESVVAPTRTPRARASQ